MRNVFAQFCSILTGYSAVELQGTGLVGAYDKLLHQLLGSKLAAEFDDLAARVVAAPTPLAREEAFATFFVASETFWPVASQLLSLWYLGAWTALPCDWYQKQGLPLPRPGELGSSHVPCASSYVEQLSYRAAMAHPPGAKPTGYASWSIPPVH